LQLVTNIPPVPLPAAEIWQESPGLIAGRDLISGGTWFGARNSRWATVTNIREGVKNETRRSSKSRGWLVRDYLQGDIPPADFFPRIEDAEDFAGFNLLLGDANELWYTSSRERAARLLPPGVYGLSNHLLDTPWPKVERGKEGLKQLLGTPELDTERAFALLAGTAVAADADLPDTGIPHEWERALSAIFITTPSYGTRCSTLLQTERGGCGRLIERRFENDPRRWQESAFSWTAQGSLLDRQDVSTENNATS